MGCAARVRGAAATALVAGALGAGTANATPPPTPPSAVAQYQEAVPTSTGTVAVTKALGHGRSTQLSPATVARVRRQGGGDATTLLQIAASGPRTTKARITVTSTGSKVHGATTRGTTTTARPRPSQASTGPSAAAPTAATTGAGWFDKSSRDVLLSVAALMALALGGAVVARRRKRL